MTASAWATLIHPAIAVLFVFPMLGIVCRMAWQTRQRRLQIKDTKKSKLPPSVGKEHVDMGKWLTGGVVGVSLVALAYTLISKQFIAENLITERPFQALFIGLIFVFTIATLILLYRAKTSNWRVTFSVLSSMGLIIIGCQDGVFRRTNEWYWSHYYYGIAASILMIISLAVVQEIYRDKSLRWRNAHIILNCVAMALFVGQGITGVRDLYEIAFYANGG
ncbi:DUF4079 domain-containing protein [Spirulina major]|uniref:DUF4079 domain-containing protein n=1 Tax=Spirulina major TaxID=270636 RepID=UPI0009330BBC|nr:DUF4079 domain-containing protein [Spirulina major]